MATVVSKFIDNITEVIGIQPATCPWDSFDDPIVQAACLLRNRVDKNVIDIKQEVAVVVEAYELMSNIASHVENLRLTAEREQREFERRVAEGNR